MKRIMSIDSDGQYGTDYSHICFLFFMMENNLFSNHIIKTKVFNTYLYRFYIDNLDLCKKHWNRMIQNIYMFKPEDLFGYCKEVLKTFKEKTEDLIDYDDEYIVFVYKIEKLTEKEQTLLRSVIKKVAEKYCGITNFTYTEALETKDFEAISDKKLGDKLFNRLIEEINYCFVCECDDINDLVITKLADSDDKYDISNYLLLCTSDHKAYKEKKLLIKKTGYPYLNGKRLYTHLNISTLKKVRRHLSD